MGNQRELPNMEAFHHFVPFSWLLQLRHQLSLPADHRVHDRVFKDGNRKDGSILYAVWRYCFSFQCPDLKQPIVWKFLRDHGDGVWTHGSSDTKLDSTQGRWTSENHSAGCDRFPIHNIPALDSVDLGCRS